ncbi:leucine--tRNA ligase [Lagierella sp.]|uniref:leucine--tRNA ligase n=1 Tax=Lagierella sp. TaxID=2849657 RepID=UPI002620517F|nr:leucine--tRNA ligase [Lagierella sp.]
MDIYNPNAIEKKWQEYWENNKTFKTTIDNSKKKFYALIEFPYPSGQGLHVGHPRPYTAMDIVSRKRRLEGYNVLYPMGWDAFGLPAENYAIKNKIHPAVITKKNIDRFREQMKSIGLSFDWDREIDTTDPNYYKWSQWIFLKFFEKGLAYKKEMPINWCPSCKAGLANEEVVGGNCERCGHPVEHKIKKQWMLKITEYADRLIDDLDEVDYSDKIKMQQINWIGRTHGAELDFQLTEVDEKLKVYTTRPDTIFGVTYMVIAIDHPILSKYKDRIENISDINAYAKEAQKKSEFERTQLVKEKTGVLVEGITATHPFTKKRLPIYVSDYVLTSYGTGAIMAVPGHDQRDFDFAMKFGLEIIPVITTGKDDSLPLTEIDSGKIINSDFIDGLSIDQAKETVISKLEDLKIGNRKTNYKLRDWVFSRQRYWGEPIPLVYCEKCGWVGVPEEDLPVKLPEVDNYEPSGDGESPLANIDSFVNTTCPRCKGPAKRETDTMPQWAGSSWYYIRYADPLNDKEIASKDAIDYYLPVDWYNGGMEHTTLHLLYSRFWHKFLYDLGVVNTKEPYMKRTSHGMILGDNGEKMSKSRGNVVNPDDIIRDYGADTLRTYEMFIGDFEKSAPWSENGVKGCRKFLERVWKLQEILTDGNEYTKSLEGEIHRTIKKVSEDYENLKFNTAIAQLMTLVNEFYNNSNLTLEDFKTFIILLNPVAPHITEELWQRVVGEGLIHNQKWPSYDEEKLIEDIIEIPVQFNGKVKGVIEISLDEDKEEIFAKVLEDEDFQKYIENKTIVKKIYVPGKILNIVLK